MKPWTDKQYDSAWELKMAYERGERPRLMFVRHFMERMRDMKVTEDEIFDCLYRPEKITFSDTHGAVNLKHGRITIGVCIGETDSYPFAATLLWRYQEDWEESSRTGTIGTGRVYRPNPTLEHRPA